MRCGLPMTRIVAKEVSWEVGSSPRDMHLLLPLLLVLFPLALLHWRTCAVRMKNSNLPLVYLVGNCI